MTNRQRRRGPKRPFSLRSDDIGPAGTIRHYGPGAPSIAQPGGTVPSNFGGYSKSRLKSAKGRFRKSAPAPNADLESSRRERTLESSVRGGKPPPSRLNLNELYRLFLLALESSDFNFKRSTSFGLDHVADDHAHHATPGQAGESKCTNALEA